MMLKPLVGSKPLSGPGVQQPNYLNPNTQCIFLSSDIRKLGEGVFKMPTLNHPPCLKSERHHNELW